MTKTQEELLKLILEIDVICQKHDIPYFMEFGSALGGLRHHGYIPWDNDMDIVMKEDDYDRFKKVCLEELDHKTRTFVDNRVDREYPSVFGHYVNLETCRMSSATDFWRDHAGQTIDVFCMLELPGDPVQRQEVIDRFYAYDEYANRSFLHYKRNTERINALYTQFKEREKEIGYDAVCREVEKQVFGHHYPDGDEYMMSSARFGGTTPFVPRSVYEEQRYVPFEGHMLPIPGDAVETLVMYYGDEFTRFPQEKRVHTEMSHAGIPSQVYVDEYLKAVDKDQLLEHREKFKELGMENGLILDQSKKFFFSLKGSMITKQMNARIEELGVDIDQLMKSEAPEDLSLLEDLFSDFIKLQLNRRVLYWRVHLAENDWMDEAAIYVLYRIRGDYTGVDRFLRLRRENGLPNTEKMDEIQYRIRRFRNMNKYMIYDEPEKAWENLLWCKENCPEVKELDLWEFRIKVARATAPEDLEDCEALQGSLPYEDNQYYQKALADLHWKAGRKEQAMEIYQNLKETSDDGLILLQITETERAAKGEAI